MGAVSWYAWWNPPIKNAMTGSTETASAFRSFRMAGANFLYGPVLSCKLNDTWNISSLFVFNEHGGYKAEGRFLGGSMRIAGYNTLLNIRFGKNFNPLIVGYFKVNSDYIKRYDNDFMIDHWFSKSLKIFFGFKYQGYRMGGTLASVFLNNQPAPGIISRIKYQHDFFGGGMGFGTTIHIADSLFLVGNLSGFLLEGKESKKFQIELRLQKPGISTYGANGNLSFAYYFEEARTTLSLGYRAQINWYGKPDLSKYENANTGMFHGLMASVIYSI